MDSEGRLGFERLFQISRISDEILYYLGRDLKAMNNLRTASKTTFQVVQQNPTFLKRARTLTVELLESSAAINNATGLLTTDWKHLKMNVDIVHTHHLELKEAGTLELLRSISIFGGPNYSRRPEEDSIYSGYLEQILELTTELMELILEDRLLLQIQDDLWRNPKVMEVLRRIESINIFSRDSSLRPIKNPRSPQQIGLEWGGEQQQSKFWQTFQLLTLAPARLRLIRLETARSHWFNFDFKSLQFLSKHDGTLEEVELHLGVLRFIPDRTPEEVGRRLSRCCTGCEVFVDYYAGWAILRPNRLEHFGFKAQVGPPQIDRDRALREVIMEIQAMGVMGAGEAGGVIEVFLR